MASTQLESDRPRGLYGRIYMAAGDSFTARIWNKNGVDVWHAVADDATKAYELMKAQARKMGEPVDCYARGASEPEVVNGTPLAF